VPQAAIAGFLVNLGATVAFAAAAAAVIQTILINIALGQITRLLTRKPRVERPPINVTIRNSIENRRIPFGTCRLGGSFAFYDNGLGYLWYVVVFSGIQVADIRDVWLDTQRVLDGDINGGAAAGGAVTAGAFANRLAIFKHLGTSAQTVDTDLDAALAVWTSNHRLRGCAYVVVRMERDDAVYQNGAPQNITALVDGALCYDPRLDSTNGGSGSHRRTDPSTWAFTRNPALHWRWYVSGGSVINDLTTRLIKYGLREIDNRIVDSYTIAAANICDETLSGGVAPPSGSQLRYRCDLEVSTGETRRDIIEDILATMAGTHVIVHGQHRIYAGAYQTPVHTFTQDDLYGQLEIEDTVDHERRYNAVAGVFLDAANENVEQTTIFRTDSAYETQDGGEQIPVEIDLRGVTNQYQAQRLCEIKLRKSRMMRSVKLVGALNLLKVAQHETLTYTHLRYGWTARVFQCAERHFEFNEEAGRVSLTCLRDDTGVWADMVTADYETGTSSTDVFTVDTPVAPTNLVSVGLHNGIRFTWTLPGSLPIGAEVELWEYTANTPFSSATRIWRGLASEVFVEKLDTTQRFYWIRIRGRTGAVSATEPSGNGLAGVAVPLTEHQSSTPADGSFNYGSINTGSTFFDTRDVTTLSYTNNTGQNVDVSIAYKGLFSLASAELSGIGRFAFMRVTGDATYSEATEGYNFSGFVSPDRKARSGTLVMTLTNGQAITARVSILLKAQAGNYPNVPNANYDDVALSLHITKR